MDGNELLEYADYPDFTGKTVLIIGGGNTAMDAARTINKKGAKKVTVVYRRARAQMPAGKEKVEKVECIKTELVKVEGGRDKPVDIKGSNYIMEADFVVMATGSKPNIKVLDSLGLELNDWGYIKVDENYETSKKNVFAAGDIMGDKSTVAWAARSGRNAAEKMCGM